MSDDRTRPQVRMSGSRLWAARETHGVLSRLFRAPKRPKGAQASSVPYNHRITRRCGCLSGSTLRNEPGYSGSFM